MKFIQPVSMIFNYDDFVKDNLKQQLIDLRYEFKCLEENNANSNILVTNFDNRHNIVTNVSDRNKLNCDRYYIDKYNPQLFLAIAAMTEGEDWIIGEHLVYIHENDVIFKVKELKYADWELGRAANSVKNRTLYRKATLDELVQHFTMKKEDREISTLPEYFAIFNDITNPLWSKYIVWLNDKYNKDYKGSTITCYYGYDGQVKRDSNISNFKNNPKVLTLEQWNNIVNGNQIKQTMKQKLTVPASDITKLYNVACVSWMKIIAGYLSEVDDNKRITFTQADIDKMFKVATSEQLLVLEEIFGKQQEVIDYNKLKAGSVVMLEFTGRIFGSKKDAEKVNFNEPFTIVFYNTSYYINSSNIYRDKSEYYDKIITFNQVNNGIGQFIAYSASDMNYIVKVISY